MYRELGPLALTQQFKITDGHRLGLRNTKQVDPTGKNVLDSRGFQFLFFVCNPLWVWKRFREILMIIHGYLRFYILFLMI